MKCVMIFVSCVLAAASAGYTAHGAHLYSAPVVGPSSYAYQNSGAYPAASHAVAYNAPVVHGYAHAAPVAHGYAHGGYYGAEARLVDPVAIAAGAPLPVGDTYEVAAAKAAHFQAHAAARGHSHVAPVAHGYGYANAAPVAHGYVHGGYYGAEARLVDPVAIAAGAPLPVGDTYEVAAAKAAHFKAQAAARGQAHVSPLSHGYSHIAPVDHGYTYSQASPAAHGYTYGNQYGSEARLVDPVAIAAGAPLPGGDTYEVAAAKAAHLKAHAVAKSGHLGLY